MDDFVIVLLTGPLFAPVAVSLGFDPIWFGIVVMINLQIAFLTPPYGFALFYMRAVVPPGITMKDIYLSVAPYVLLQIIGFTLVLVFPQLALWLPSLIFNK